MPVELTGVNELRKALKQYAPDLDKQLKKDLKIATSDVVKAARGYAPTTAPLSNWGKGTGKFPIYNAKQVTNGIRLSTARSRKNNKGFSSSIRIVNASAAGAIYETAGRLPSANKPSSRPNFTAAMYGEMKGKGKERGRLIYRAWQEDNGKTQDAVIKAVMKTNQLFESKTKGFITRGVRKAA